jgi:hypothetical protein
MTPAGVKSRLHRARQALSKLLHPPSDGGGRRRDQSERAQLARKRLVDPERAQP